MRKHGWQLPFHPLQVVAVAVFSALGFAFYVFFAPIVGKKLFQYIALGIYTPLVVCVFGLYNWCAATDPADPAVFKSKKYLKVQDSQKHLELEQSKLGGQSTSSIQDANAATTGDQTSGKSDKDTDAKADLSTETGEKAESPNNARRCTPLLAFMPCALVHNCLSHGEDSSEQQMSEDGMFYCSLCELEWLNNCIGKKNYRMFFTLMASALLMLILQWSTGIFVLICCFLEKKKFSSAITTKLGSSFTVAPFVIVVAVCTILAMIATLPMAQLFFFHILLIKKGISTYDYIIALREQEQQGIGGQQSPQMSSVSSLTGLSSASSFNNIHRAAWCTPPRLFLEDQFDVVPPEAGSVSSFGRKTVVEPIKKKNPVPVKISPRTLARMNAQEVSKAAAEARKKSKVLQPVTRQETQTQYGLETGSSRRRMVPRPDNNRKRSSKRIRLPTDLSHDSQTKVSNDTAEISMRGIMTDSLSNLAPFQYEARSAFRSMFNSAGIVASSPESSLDSPDLHPFGVSGAEDARCLVGLSAASLAPPPKDIPLTRSTSDGYDASGGEDSDRVVPPRIVQRSSNWSSLLFGSERDKITRLNASSSSGQADSSKQVQEQALWIFFICFSERALSLGLNLRQVL